MEHFGHSSNTLSHCEFKVGIRMARSHLILIKLSFFNTNVFSLLQFVPKLEFAKVMRKVERDRREKSDAAIAEKQAGSGVGYWGNVCSVSSVDGSDDENSVTRTNSQEVLTIFDSRGSNAPLFGPPRKHGEEWESRGWKLCNFFNFKSL